MKLTLILLTLIVLTSNTVSAQQDIFLKSKKSGKLKKLKPKTNFAFNVKTTDHSKSISYYGRIIQTTDSTLILEEYIKPSLRAHITPDIWTLNIHDIKSIKNYLIDNDDFNTLGGMLIIGGVLGLVATPIVWVAEGQEAGQEGAIFTAGLFATGGLLLLPQFIGKRRQTAKWEFVKG